MNFICDESMRPALISELKPMTAFEQKNEMNSDFTNHIRCFVRDKCEFLFVLQSTSNATTRTASHIRL